MRSTSNVAVVVAAISPSRLTGKRLVGDQAQAPGGEVVHPVVLDEVAGPEQPRDREVVAQPALLDGVHVEEVVVDRGVRRHGEPASVVPPVADGDLHEVGELEGGAVVEAAGGERSVVPVRRQGGRRVGEAAEPLLQRGVSLWVTADGGPTEATLR